MPYSFRAGLSIAMHALKRIFLLALGCAAACLVARAEPAVRPNIVFIMSDDHATSAVSAYVGLSVAVQGRCAGQGLELGSVDGDGQSVEACFGIVGDRGGADGAELGWLGGDGLAGEGDDEEG